MCTALNKEMEDRHEAELTPYFVNYHDNKHRAEQLSSKTQLISTATNPWPKMKECSWDAFQSANTLVKINRATA